MAVEDTVKQSSADYIYEPSQTAIIDELLPKSLKMQLFKAVRDSFASEHGARMIAMHKATDNATELGINSNSPTTKQDKLLSPMKFSKLWAG